jgi:hypothetical protein
MSETEQRHVIKVLDVKKFAFDRVTAKLVSVYAEQIYAKNAVEYWIHQVKLGRSEMEDEAMHGRPPLGDVDARILACLSYEPFSMTRSIAQARALRPGQFIDILPSPWTGHLDTCDGSPCVESRIEGSAGKGRLSAP